MKKLYYGDNLDVMRRYIRDNTVDLCYIDPPFNSKRNYNQIYNNLGEEEDKAQAQAFIDTWTWDDEAVKGLEQITSNYNGVFTKQSIELIIGLEKVLEKGSLFAYLINMTLRIAEIFRVLKPTGSFYLHCDPTASHYLKLVLDGIFIPNGGEFRNEICWCYSIGGRSSESFARKHDIILFYSKSKKWTFNGDNEHVRVLRKPNSHMKVITDENGNSWQVKTDSTTGKEYRYPFDKIATDYWTDIEQLNREDAERLGYPTQKPEALLERIIGASSNKGDVILDAYCGCGTSVIVAERRERQWIGIDITYQSISLILKRLEDTFKGILDYIELNGIPKDFESAVALANKKEDKTRKEFEKWAVLTYSNNRAIINEKKGADKGIDGIAYMLDRNESNENEMKQVLFSVKSDKTPHVSFVRDLNGTIEREKAVMGYLITLYPPTQPMKDECKTLGFYKNKLMEKDYPKIDVVTVQDILDGKRMTIPISHQIDVVKSAQKSGAEQERLI